MQKYSAGLDYYKISLLNTQQKQDFIKTTVTISVLSVSLQYIQVRGQHFLLLRV